MSDEPISNDCHDLVPGASLVAGGVAGLAAKSLQVGAAVQQLSEAGGHYLCDHPPPAVDMQDAYVLGKIGYIPGEGVPPSFGPANSYDLSVEPGTPTVDMQDAYVLGKIGYVPGEGAPPSFGAANSHDPPVGPGLAEPLLADHELPQAHPDALALGDLHATPTIDTPVLDGLWGPFVNDGWTGASANAFTSPAPPTDEWHAGFGFAPDVHALGASDLSSFDQVELGQATIAPGGGIHEDVSGLATDHWLAPSPFDVPQGFPLDLVSPTTVPDPWGTTVAQAYGHDIPSWTSDHSWSAPAWHNDTFGSGPSTTDFGHSAGGSTSIPHAADLGGHATGFDAGASVAAADSSGGGDD